MLTGTPRNGFEPTASAAAAARRTHIAGEAPDELPTTARVARRRPSAPPWRLWQDDRRPGL